MSVFNLRQPLRNLSVLFILILLALVPGHLSAASVQNKLALGVPYTGVQIHWGFAKKWALEARALVGKADTAADDIESDVYGLRLYNYFHRPTRVRFFWGLELATTRSSAENTDYKTTGMATGAFLGTELYLLRRLSVGIDAGPYLISSETRTTGTRDSETDFVLNTFMNFYFL